MILKRVCVRVLWILLNSVTQVVFGFLFKGLVHLMTPHTPSLIYLWDGSHTHLSDTAAALRKRLRVTACLKPIYFFQSGGRITRLGRGPGNDKHCTLRLLQVFSRIHEKHTHEPPTKQFLLLVFPSRETDIYFLFQAVPNVFMLYINDKHAYV